MGFAIHTSTKQCKTILLQMSFALAANQTMKNEFLFYFTYQLNIIFNNMLSHLCFQITNQTLENLLFYNCKMISHLQLTAADTYMQPNMPIYGNFMPVNIVLDLCVENEEAQVRTVWVWRNKEGRGDDS